MKQEKSSSFIDYLTVVFKWRRFIIRIFLIITIAAVVISLILPLQYTATTTILPPNPQQEAMFGLMGMNITSNIGGVSGLASMLPGATSMSDLFAAILQSGTIAGRIIKKYDLQSVFKAKTMDDAHKMLLGITKFRVAPEGIIAVSVTWYDKNLAADIANSYIEELDKFNTETAMTTGKRYRIFIEKRLEESTNDMAEAEEALRQFQEKHRTVALEEEIISAIKTIAELKSQIILLEVKKGALSSSSQYNNPYLYDINRELNELKKQLNKIEFGTSDTTKKEFGAGFSVPFVKLPEVAVEYARLFRDVEVQAAIYELLTQQYEQAKIMEVKDTPTIQILDRASPPEKKSMPKRSRIVILAAFFSIIFGISISFFLEWYEQLKDRPNEYAKVADIRTKLKTDIHTLKSKLIRIFKPKKS
jgi:tyrosine-protein kinase Etk/Wzc